MDHIDVRVEQSLVSIRPRGSLSQEQLQYAMELLKTVHDQQGNVFLLVDMIEGERMPPTVRRTIAQMFSEFAPVAVAVHGANLEQRAAHELLMGAVAGVSGRRINVAYFQSEAEAREWLAAERRRIEASG